MLNKSIKFLIENKLMAVWLLVLFVDWKTVNAPFNWNTGSLPRNPVAVDDMPDIEDQVSYRLTRSLLGISEVKTVRSSSMLGVFTLFRKYYTRILNWALHNKMLFLSLPMSIVVFGVIIMKNTDKEFMTSLNEGSFLLMPISLSHAGATENKRVLQLLDMAVASIPEIKTVVGKAGRTGSVLEPAPLSMYENMIQYKSEYMLNKDGKRQAFKVNDDGLFYLKNGNLIGSPNTEIEDDVNYQELDIGKVTETIL